MYSIGELARQTGVKIPTIRYYEEQGLISAVLRTAGNQRRFGEAELERLSFIKHARDLGFPLSSVQALIRLQTQPNLSCKEALDIAQQQLEDVRQKIARLSRLEKDLTRIRKGCSGSGLAQDCYVLASLGDHSHCDSAH